jgi:hypothetical protein
LTQTIISRRRNQWPDRRIFGDLYEFCTIAATGTVSPFAHLFQVTGKRSRNVGYLVYTLQAKIIRAAFEQCCFDRPSNGLADQRKIAVIELILQSLRASTDYGLAAAQQRRQQVCEGLTRARARLDNEFVRFRDSLSHRLGHPRLTRPRLKTG